MTLNHEQKFDKDWSWFTNMGYSRRSGNKDNQGASLAFNEKGEFVDNQFNQQNEAGKNAYIQFGIKGIAHTGEVKHNLALAVDRSWAKYWNKSKGYKHNDQNTAGNLYDGIIFPDNYKLQNFGSAVPEWEETNVGITVADTMEFGKASVMLAASHKHENFEKFKIGEKPAESITNDNILPTYGFTYKPVENLALYYGHTESFSRGLVVPKDNKGKPYTNYGQVFDPVKSKQNEIGVKYQNAGLMTTLSYFDINEANRYDIDAGPDKLTKVEDGENRYKGVELTVNGKLADKWNVTGGVLYLDAKREKTKDGKKDGFFVTGVSEWSGVLGLEYTPDEDWSLIGRAVWSDKAYVESSKGSGKYEIPSHITYDLGVSYKTKINTVPVKLSAMCYNVADKDYWMGRGGTSTFGLSMPRTFMVSAQFDL